MKRIGIVVIASMMAMFALAACQSGTGGTSGAGGTGKTSGVTIKMIGGFDRYNKEDPFAVMMDEMLTEFENETGIKVEVENTPWEQLESKVVLTNEAGNPPDIAWISSQKLASLINADALLPLDDYVSETYTEEDLNDFASHEKAATTSALDGKKYLFLASIHTRYLWYNKDLVQTPPTNWEELIEIGKQLTDPAKNQYGFGFWGNKHYGSVEIMYAPMIWSAGGRITDDNGRAVWDSPEAAEAVQFISDLVNVHKIAPESVLTQEITEIDKIFLAGNIAMILEGAYRKAAFWDLSDLGKAGKLGIAPMPGKDGPAPMFINGWSLGIPKKAKHPDAAWKFIEFFNRTENQIKHALVKGGAPTRKSAWEDERFQGEYWDMTFEVLEKYSRPMDPIVYYQEGLDALNLAGLEYMLDPGSKDLKQLLEESARNFNTKYYPE